VEQRVKLLELRTVKSVPNFDNKRSRKGAVRGMADRVCESVFISLNSSFSFSPCMFWST